MLCRSQLCSLPSIQIFRLLFHTESGAHLLEGSRLADQTFIGLRSHHERFVLDARHSFQSLHFEVCHEFQLILLEIDKLVPALHDGIEDLVSRSLDTSID